MGNAPRLCGNEGAKHKALQRLRVCHIGRGGGGGCGRECKATQGGQDLWNQRGPSQEKTLKDLVPT